MTDLTGDPSLPAFSRPTWAAIDLDALRRNLLAVQSAGGGVRPLLAVIKANAYGHGAVLVARVLAPPSTPAVARQAVPGVAAMLAVASVDEGLQLREAGIEAPILLLSAMLPSEVRAVVRANLLPTVCTRDVALALEQAGAAEGRVVDAHLKIDTGMGRFGVWHTEAAAFYRSLRELRQVRTTGIYTHLACADEPDDTMTGVQLRAFQTALGECAPPCSGVSAATRPEAPCDWPGVVIHAANSAAALRYPAARFDMVRPGIALYGVLPESVPADAAGVKLRGVMKLQARVTHLKRVPPGTTISYGATWRAPRAATIATVPVGYADGYPRRLSNLGRVLIRGIRCPIVGRVTMDQIMVDCTELDPQVTVGEIVTLFGPGLPVEEVARWAGTIAYEILCGIAQRVPRVYCGEHSSWPDTEAARCS